MHINESTARRLQTEYLQMLKKEILKEKDRPSRSDEDTAPREPIVITSLETKDRGRPLLLGEELDAAVQEFANNLWAANGVVNRLVVMGAAEGIISHRDVSKLSSHGGHIKITKSWAKSLLNRMGFVKRKCSTSGKIIMLCAVHYNYNALCGELHEICSAAHSFDLRCESVTSLCIHLSTLWQ